MPDISMCQNEKCKLKMECFRYMAKPSGRQSYADFDENNCSWFMRIEDYKKLEKTQDES
jgi:hypothetical protein